MYSKFPISLTYIPRQKHFACFSLKFGCILSGLIVILYSILAIAQCAAVLSIYAPKLSTSDIWGLVAYGLTIIITISHAITLFLSAIMLAGALSEKIHLIKPWVIWVSLQVMASVLLFIFWSTVNMINHFADSSLMAYVIEFLILLIRFYMLMLVGNYYKQLEEEKGETDKLLTILNTEAWYTA